MMKFLCLSLIALTSLQANASLSVGDSQASTENVYEAVSALRASGAVINASELPELSKAYRSAGVMTQIASNDEVATTRIRLLCAGTNGGSGLRKDAGIFCYGNGKTHFLRIDARGLVGGVAARAGVLVLEVPAGAKVSGYYGGYEAGVAVAILGITYGKFTKSYEYDHTPVSGAASKVYTVNYEAGLYADASAGYLVFGDDTEDYLY